MGQLFSSDDQNAGVSASASVFPMSIQGFHHKQRVNKRIAERCLQIAGFRKWRAHMKPVRSCWCLFQVCDLFFVMFLRFLVNIVLTRMCAAMQSLYRYRHFGQSYIDHVTIAVAPSLNIMHYCSEGTFAFLFTV